MQKPTINAPTKIISTYGEWVYHNSADVETVSDAGFGFSDGEAENNVVHCLADFVGRAFHLIQQTGGHLFFRQQEVCATEMHHTSGDAAQPQWIVQYGGVEISIADLLGPCPRVSQLVHTEVPAGPDEATPTNDVRMNVLIHVQRSADEMFSSFAARNELTLVLNERVPLLWDIPGSKHRRWSARLESSGGDVIRFRRTRSGRRSTVVGEGDSKELALRNLILRIAGTLMSDDEDEDDESLTEVRVPSKFLPENFDVQFNNATIKER